MKFNGENEMKAAIATITNELGEKAFRVAGAENTIEIFEDLQRLLPT